MKPAQEVCDTAPVTMREVLQAAFLAGVDDVEARPATAAVVPELGLDDCPACVLALGKAAVGMAHGFADAHRGRLRGVVVADAPGPVPRGMRLLLGDHPMPSSRSLDAGETLLRSAASAAPSETVVVLVSGGGSALAEALVPGVTLDDMQAVTMALLRSGAPIGDINAVRIALSRLKGGGLAAAAGGRSVVTIAISDVIGDDPGLIASGPTVAADHDTRSRTVIAELDQAVPASVQRAVARRDPLPRASADAFVLAATRHMAAAAARAELRRAGWSVDVVDEPLQGEAAVRAGEIVAAAEPGRAQVWSGETTVTVRGSGIGGRNHEAALAAALALDGTPDVAFLAAGTDGIDGMTAAAGAAVDGDTAGAGRALGLDPAAHLAANDSGGFFDRAPGRIVTGRTGTNVGDLWIVARR